MSSLGIKHDLYLPVLDVPGTVQLLEKRIDGEAPDVFELKKKGDIVLTPQPHADPNDPLNWPQWRRDLMLIVLGFHSLVGGGQTPILAAGFKSVSKQFGVTTTKVSYTTGVYMLFLGIGSVFVGPAAAIVGKRPVYLGGQVVFCIACLWAAASQSYGSLLAARVLEGFGVAPVECLPSSSIAEIFFLHERAFRLGIYTMLLLGGKNIVPLVSAAVIESLGWRFVFWIVAIIVGFNCVCTFFFVPETSWDRTVKPAPSLRTISRRTSMMTFDQQDTVSRGSQANASELPRMSSAGTLSNSALKEKRSETSDPSPDDAAEDNVGLGDTTNPKLPSDGSTPDLSRILYRHADMRRGVLKRPGHERDISTFSELTSQHRRHPVFEIPLQDVAGVKEDQQPIYVKRSWISQLAIFRGRLTHVPYWKILLRPFVLFAYPAIAFSTLIYSLSVVWLIVMSETLGQIFQAEPYNFSALSVGLLYISPLIGGILGSSVAGKLSDILTRYMSRRNDGIYEPEFRLVLALPVAIVTALGLMGFGWSAYNHDPWIAPDVFFGAIAFGCSLGSTLSVSFVVDSYKEHAGEALVTMNLTKNVLGFIFSLWYNDALTADGSRTIFLILGFVQILCCVFAIPMYIYGKRFRSWTFRKGMIDWLYE